MKPTEELFGFASFFKEDGGYFFQFNDKAGQPIFYSHGYQSERSRDNGIQATIRNAGEEKHFEKKKSGKGQYCFILRSGNNQEIGRSITFDTKAEMEEKLNVMKGITEDVPIFSRSEMAAKKEAAQARAVVEPTELFSSRELPIEGLPRYKFSLIYYPDSDVWNIKHDQSGSTRQFKTYDGKRIEEFLKVHLPAEKARAVATSSDPAMAPSRATAQEGIPRKQDKVDEEQIELKLRSFRGEEARHFARTGNLGQLEILPKKERTVRPHVFDAKVTARSVERNETVVIAEVKAQKPAYGRFVIPINEANNLKPGIYRFTVAIHQGEKGEEAHDYLGSSLVMLN